MTALNKQALREAAEKAKAARARLESMPDEDVVLFEDDDIKSDVYTCNKFIVTANPATVLALLDELEAAERQNGYLREQREEWERKAISNFEECMEMAARIEELEAQRKLAFTASNRWSDKFREAEKRIAEMEARAVSVPEVRITVAESRRKNLTWRELGVYNEGADVAKEAIIEAIRAAGIGVKGE
ncbi:ead/Ea22-like family protein [Salmonella enterica subsp. enterica serovar Newport]|uniref:Ead/Ea22-like family protein n=1 Tax=Salmonella enterica TaxID=28901 RepID=A0A746UVK4_SALER|nr:hypothetical protein [Salmonella enterica]